MKVIVKSLNEEELEENDYQDRLEISINGETKFSVYDGEPEDNTLGRNFNDCFSIINLMKLAYEAGKNGEEFIVED